MKAVIEKKNEEVQKTAELLSGVEALIISEYRGVKVNELNKLRKDLKANDYNAEVIKNTKLRRVLTELSIDIPESLLKGPNICFNAKSDVVKLTKLLVDFEKSNEAFSLKGGALNNEYIDVDQIKQLSKLPSKAELIAKAVGLIKAPLTGLVARLSSPTNGFVNVLNNIKDKK